ncbi:dehydrogenase [Leptospira mtsangambouensis]|uniref:Dehydrogenase n=1 Tax=Leptospira mtsangambouensis TaxID=2484912 RepID=A0ABY2P499_9LEPT|nr:phosphoglycerate dehydrogenase [Leptospira mtsangambouensis]TGM82299.1 dehydrogenase [Leptospira mtsangambouensis]
MANVFVSTYPFCRSDKQAIDHLLSNGHHVVINPLERKMKPSEVLENAENFDALIAGTEDLTPLVEKTSQLKLISRVGVGLDSVPLDLCAKKSISVAYTPDAVSPAVSELAIGLMVDLMRQVSFADREIRKGLWTRPYGNRIGGSSIGILGFGRIGKRVASHLIGFLPKEILICDLVDKSKDIEELQRLADGMYSMNSRLGKNWGKVKIRQVELVDLVQNSDILTIHVPLSESTMNMFHLGLLNQMKSSAFLINTARGGIVNESDLYQVLKSKGLAGAALDVFDEEPYFGALKEFENVILTQHMGSCSNDCRADMEREAAEEVVRFFNGEPLVSKVI